MIPMLLMTLATATPEADPQISGNWLIAAIGAVFSGVALLMGKKIGKAEAQSMRLEEPVPTIPFRKVPGVPSWNDHSNLVERVGRLEAHIDRMRDEQAQQFKELLTAGANRQTEIVEKLSEKIDAVAREWHGRLDNLQANKPRPTR